MSGHITPRTSITTVLGLHQHSTSSYGSRTTLVALHLSVTNTSGSRYSIPQYHDVFLDADGDAIPGGIIGDGGLHLGEQVAQLGDVVLQHQQQVGGEAHLQRRERAAGHAGRVQREGGWGRHRLPHVGPHVRQQQVHLGRERLDVRARPRDLYAARSNGDGKLMSGHNRLVESVTKYGGHGNPKYELHHTWHQSSQPEGMRSVDILHQQVIVGLKPT